MTTSSNSNQGTASTHALVEQVQARRAELTQALTAKETSPSTRTDIEAAIAALAPMLTGDLANIPDMVSRDLIKWLDTSKYLGAHPTAAGTHAGGASSAGISTASSPGISTASSAGISTASSPGMAVKVEDTGPSSAAVTVPPSSES